MCFAWNRLCCNPWAIFNASKCVVINRIKSPISSPLKSGTTFYALIISNNISDTGKEKAGHLILLGSTSNVLAFGGAMEKDFLWKEMKASIFCGHFLKGFRTCHVSFLSFSHFSYLFTTVNWKPQSRFVSVWPVVVLK